ncbi:MAG: hypothetical protein FLDDKLPJ_02949 [Phycisphaerae bacterium]|nr:hypothetical protein [Phycisphaerae bacterium]
MQEAMRAGRRIGMVAAVVSCGIGLAQVQAQSCFDDLWMITLIRGTDGPDSIQGTIMPERICSFGGADYVAAGIPGCEYCDGCDFVSGGDGDDPDLNGNPGDDYINGGPGQDVCLGGKDNDTLRGGQGNDRLHGDAGHDVMWGDLDDDYLVNWDGDDTYVYRRGDGNDTIEDSNGLNVLMFLDISGPTDDYRVGADRVIEIPDGRVVILDYFSFPGRWVIQYAIPCNDLRSFSAKCKRGKVKAKAVMRNDSHDGKHLLFGASYLNYRAEIRDDKAVFKNSGECLQMIGEFDVYLASHERCGGFREHVVCQ